MAVFTKNMAVFTIKHGCAYLNCSRHILFKALQREAISEVY